MSKSRLRVPAWLDGIAKTEWKRMRDLLDLDTFSSVDLKALEAYCQAYAKWKRCELILMDKGYTFETPSGYEQQRPEVSISKDALTSMQSIAKELGFTSASRIRMDKNRGGVSSGGGEADGELEEMIVK